MSNDAETKDPAFPCPEAGMAHFGQESAYMGLTKRELFAAMVLAGFAADPSAPALTEGPVQNAVIAADALIKELAK